MTRTRNTAGAPFRRRLMRIGIGVGALGLAAIAWFTLGARADSAGKPWLYIQLETGGYNFADDPPVSISGLRRLYFDGRTSADLVQSVSDAPPDALMMDPRYALAGSISGSRLRALRTRIGQQDFQDAIEQGFRCGQGPTDVGATLLLVYADGHQVRSDVSACYFNQDTPSQDPRVDQVLHELKLIDFPQAPRSVLAPEPPQGPGEKPQTSRAQ